MNSIRIIENKSGRNEKIFVNDLEIDHVKSVKIKGNIAEIEMYFVFTNVEYYIDAMSIGVCCIDEIIDCEIMTVGNEETLCKVSFYICEFTKEKFYE